MNGADALPDTVQAGPRVRTLQPEDLTAVVALDALLTGQAKEAYWRGVFERFLRGGGCIGLAATAEPGAPDDPDGGDARLDGYLFGEVRAFEFGSEACGWIFAVGVHQDAARSGVASALLDEARRLFRASGVSRLRTMVRRTDVPFLSFFRRHGFVGGPFAQLELDMTDENDAEERS